MKIILLAISAASIIQCVSLSALTPEQLEKLSSKGYLLNQSLVYNLFPEWTTPLIRQNSTIKSRYNYCYDPFITKEEQIDLFEDRLDDALNTYFTIYLKRFGLKTVPFERITIFLSNTADFLRELKKCVDSESGQFNRLGINPHFVLDKNELAKLELDSDFLESRMKLGSKASYSNRNKSCSLVMERFGSVKLPASFNWVDHGVVTPIKHQGPCGSCVDFGTIATVEAAYHLQLGRPLTNFSEQDVVNCFANFGRGGCSASWADEVLEFIMTRGLVKSKGWYGNTSLDSDYKAKVLECDEKPKLVPEKLVDYCFYVNLPDDQKLMELVYNMGPVIVPISTYDRSLLYLKDAPYVTGCGRRSGGHVIAMVVIAIILSSTQLWMFSAIPAKNSDSDWDWDWTTYNDLNECSTIGLFTINPYELNPTTPENAIKFCKTISFCEKPANPNTLLKERICYSYRSALSPIVTCGMMFVNLTSLLVDEVEESNSGIEANQTVADYICLSAKLSRECLELRTTRTCAKVLGTTFTEMTVNSQMDEEYINNYLRYL
ncbi:hypothetical protein TYRP_020763, partial [Tyrophagus putrescentiae]